MNKFIGSKLYHILNLLFDLFIINILTIFFSIGIVTIIPSAMACFYVCKNFINNKSGEIFRPFFTGFKKYFKKGLYLNIILIVTLFILYFSAFQFETLLEEGAVYFVGMIICYILMVICIYLCLQFFLINIYIEDISFFDSLKLSVFFSKRFYRTQIQMVLWILADILLIYLFWPFAFLFGLSLTIYLISLGTKNLYLELAVKFNTEGETLENSKK